MPTKVPDTKLSRSDKQQYERLLEEYGDPEKATFYFMRWKAQTDTYYLGTKVLKLFDNPRGKRRLDPKFHGMICSYLDQDDDSMIIVPRDHLKSTWVRVWAVRQYLADPNVRVGYFVKSAQLAWSGIAQIKRWLGQPLVLHLFPEFDVPTNRWVVNQKEKFTIIRDEELGYVPPESAVEAWGVESTVVGKHYDYHLYDDVVDKESTRTASGLRKTDEWWSAMQPIKDPAAIDKYVATPYHYRDLTHRILEEGLYDKKNILWVPVEVNGKFNYSFYNKKILEKKRRSMTPYDFSSQYYLDTRPKEDRFFVPPYPVWMPGTLPEDPKYYIAVDPAATTGVYSDKTGIVIGCVDRKHPTKFFCVEAFGVKKEPSEVASLLVQKIIQYKPVRVGIEYGLQVALQALIDAKLQEEQRTRHDFYWPDFLAIPTKQGKKQDKIYRTIAAFVKDARFLMKADDEGKYDPAMDELRDQMEFYNPNTDKNDDDVLDAGAMVLQTVEHFSAGNWYKAGGYEAPALFTWDWHKKRQRMQNRDSEWGSTFAA